MLDVSHPVEAGFVASLARPGGNITADQPAQRYRGKALRAVAGSQLGLTRIAVLYTPSNAGSALGMKEQEEFAKQHGATLVPVPINTAADVETAFSVITRERAQALHIHPTPVTSTHRVRIAALAAEHRLPSITAFKVFVRDGVLMSYGPDQVESWRRIAAYVDRILRGASPGDLPVEQPTKFELHINVRTAKAIGIIVPPPLLARADGVIK